MNITCLNQDHSFEIDNLILHEKYSYVINVLHSDLPITISNRTGDFTAYDTEKSIRYNISFCPSFVECNTSDSGYVDSTHTDQNLSNVVSCDLELVITMSYTNIVVGTVQKHITCNISNNSLPKIDSLSYSHLNNDLTQISSVMMNLLPTKQYNYLLSANEGNRSFISIPISGSVTTDSNGSATVLSVLYRCPTESVCPSGTTGLLSNSRNTYRDLYGDFKDFLSLNLDISNMTGVSVLRGSITIDDFDTSNSSNGVAKITVSNDPTTSSPNVSNPSRRPSLR
jgi:hypothetical protein